MLLKIVRTKCCGVWITRFRIRGEAEKVNRDKSEEETIKFQIARIK